MPMPVAVEETQFKGVLEVRTGLIQDDRGFFSESYSKKMWAAAGFKEEFVQDNLSLSRKGTLRGMHYQIAPAEMGKLVRVVRGAIFDVGVDLRRDSPTFGQWIGRELSVENNLALYFPPGFAHGFLATEDDSLVYYKCTNYHTPEAERALNYADPKVGIEWPAEPRLVSPKDAQAPCFEDAEYNFTL